MPTIVDTKEIANRLNVAERTVHSWRRRNIDFPEPAGRVAGRPYWHWEEIKSWATTTGRG